MPIQTYIQDGFVVGYSPEFGVGARTSLAKTARRLGRQGDVHAAKLGHRRHWVSLDGMQPNQVEVGSLISVVKSAAKTVAKPIAKAAKTVAKPVAKVAKPVVKAAKKVTAVAHSVTQNKVVKAIEGQMQKMVPPPYNTLVPVAKVMNKQAATLIEKAVKDPKSNAAKVADVAKKAAAGTVPMATLTATATALKVPVDQAKSLATLGRLELLSKTDPKAAATKQVLNMVAQAAAGEPGNAQALLAENELRKQYPNARAFTIRGRDGKTYNTIVVPQ